MTTFERTWEWTTGNDINASTGYDDNQCKAAFMVGLKRALVGEFFSWTAPWTVAGSGGGTGGGGMDGVDRWGISYLNADATGNWMCLRGPAGTPFADVWFTIINSGTYGNGRMVFTDAAPTGGAETTPPTFSGKVIDTGAITIYDRYDAVARPHKITLGMTTLGGWYAFFTDGSGHVWPETIWAFMEVADGKSGDLPGCYLIDTLGATTQIVSGTGSMGRMWHNDGSTTTVQLLAPYYYNTSIFTGFAGDNWEVGTPTPDYPVFLWSSTTLKQAFRGRIIDLYFGSDLTSQNTVEPSSGPPYQSVKFGAFWWPGATTAVVI